VRRVRGRRALIVRTVVSVRIDGGSARLQPHPWLTRCPGNRLSNDARRQDARLHDLFSIGGVVSAIDTASGQIDHNVGPIDLALPMAEGRAIPGNDAPWANVGTTAQDDHVVAVSVKCAGKNGSDLSGSPRNDDLHCTLTVLLDEATSEFRRRHRALFVAAEDAIPGSSDNVVQPIEKRFR